MFGTNVRGYNKFKNKKKKNNDTRKNTIDLSLHSEVT